MRLGPLVVFPRSRLCPLVRVASTLTKGIDRLRNEKLSRSHNSITKVVSV